MRTNLDLSTIPLPLLIGMGILLLVQLALAAVALVNLYRRPAATVATGNKWIWVAVVLLLSFIGPILYFAIGRKQAQAIDRPVEQKRSSAAIADALYRNDDEPKQQ